MRSIPVSSQIVSQDSREGITSSLSGGPFSKWDVAASASAVSAPPLSAEAHRQMSFSENLGYSPTPHRTKGPSRASRAVLENVPMGVARPCADTFEVLDLDRPHRQRGPAIMPPPLAAR